MVGKGEKVLAVGLGLAVGFGSRGMLAVSQSARGSALLWDLASKKQSKLNNDFNDFSSLKHVKFSPDGTSLFAVREDNSARVLDVTTRTAQSVWHTQLHFHQGITFAQ